MSKQDADFPALGHGPDVDVATWLLGHADIAAEQNEGLVQGSGFGVGAGDRCACAGVLLPGPSGQEGSTEGDDRKGQRHDALPADSAVKRVRSIHAWVPIRGRY